MTVPTAGRDGSRGAASSVATATTSPSRLSRASDGRSAVRARARSSSSSNWVRAFCGCKCSTIGLLVECDRDGLTGVTRGGSGVEGGGAISTTSRAPWRPVTARATTCGPATMTRLRTDEEGLPLAGVTGVAVGCGSGSDAGSGSGSGAGGRGGAADTVGSGSTARDSMAGAGSEPGITVGTSFAVGGGGTDSLGRAGSSRVTSGGGGAGCGGCTAGAVGTDAAAGTGAAAEAARRRVTGSGAATTG